MSGEHQTGFDLQALQAHEEKYIFPHFSRKDLDLLADIMIRKSRESGDVYCFELELNGCVYYCFLPDGTGEFNKIWMDKKLSTVRIMQKSTMLLWKGMEAMGIPRKPEMIPAGDVITCGGSFPIRVKDTGVIGGIAVSGPGDEKEQAFIIDCLEELLGGM